MSEWSDYNGQYATLFYHISRHAELVVVKDRDVLAFIPEMALQDATDGMKIWRDQAHTFKQWETASTEKVLLSERVLLWARVSGTEIVSGFRWVPYITSRDVDAANIKPLREVFAPRVVFDASSNMLHLWFWTNVMWTYQGKDYDESKLVPIGTQGYQLEMGYPGYPAHNLKRVLCYATGMLGHWYVEGGFIAGFQGLQTVSGPQGTGFDSNIYDLVPVFTLPRIITNYAPIGPADEGPGMITDGWYEGTGGQGPQGDDGLEGPQGFMGNQGFQGAQGFQGLQGFQGYQGGQGFQGCMACEEVHITGATSNHFYTDVTPNCWQIGEVVCFHNISKYDIHYTSSWAEGQIDGVMSGSSFDHIRIVWPGTGNIGELPSMGDFGTLCHGGCRIGFQGFQGPQGPQGPQGYQGPQGNMGDIGPQGEQGNQGPAGHPGDRGFDGYQGPQGPQGPPGLQGPQGPQGPQGNQGNWGFQGYMGPFGVMGLQGPQGYQGCPGCEIAVSTNTGFPGQDEYQVEPWHVTATCWTKGENVCFHGDSGGSWDATVDTGAFAFPSGGRIIIHWSDPNANHGEDGTLCHGSCPLAAQGLQGVVGIQGVQGYMGYQGFQGVKTAIVASSEGYIELACIETPEVLFFDIMELQYKGHGDVYELDKLFVEVCEPGSIRILSAVSDKLIPVVAEMISDDAVMLWGVNDGAYAKMTLMLSGTRKGFAGRRFASRTEQDYDRNVRFWNRQQVD